MAITIQLKRGVQSTIDNYIGSPGELVYDTTNNALRIHNGSQTGGYQIPNKTTNDGLYFSKSGGLLNGSISTGATNLARNSNDTTWVDIWGGTSFTNSAYLRLDSSGSTSNVPGPGGFSLNGRDGTNISTFYGTPAGILRWKDKNLVRSVDGLTADDNGNVNTRNWFESKANNPVTSTANDTKDTWSSLRGGVYWFSQLNCLNDQLGQWGYLLNITGGAGSSEIFQIWQSQPGHRMAFRGANGSGWNGTQKHLIDSTGGQTINGVLYAQSFQISSDRRLKSDIEPIEDSLNKLDQLTGYTFKMKDVESRQAGLIAQDVEAVLPEAISENDKQFKTINYAGVIGLLVEAVKQLKQQVATLQQNQTINE